MRQEHRREQAGTRTTPRLPPRRGSIERGKLDHSAKNDDAAGVHALTGLAVDPARVLSMRRDRRERQHSEDGNEEIQNRERASESNQGASRDSPAAKRAENSVGNPKPVRPRGSGTEEGVETGAVWENPKSPSGLEVLNETRREHAATPATRQDGERWR